MATGKHVDSPGTLVAINNLQVTLVDHWVGEYNERGLKRIEDRWMVKMGPLFVGANARNEVLNN